MKDKEYVEHERQKKDKEYVEHERQMKDKEYVEQLIADMQDAEDQLFTKEMLLQRMGYIKACMNNVNVALPEKEIYNILGRVNHGQNNNIPDR